MSFSIQSQIIYLPIRSAVETADWYHSILGFEVLHTDQYFSIVRWGDVKLVFRAEPGYAEMVNTEYGRIRLTWEVTGLSELVEVLKEAGTPIEEPLTQVARGYWTCSFLDVNGYRITVSEQLPESALPPRTYHDFRQALDNIGRHPSE